MTRAVTGPGGGGSGLCGATRAVAAYASALAVSTGCCLLASVLHLEVSRPLALGALLAGALAGVWTVRALSTGRRAPPGSSALAIATALALGVVAIPLHLALAVAALSKPDMSWDGNTYHVPAVHFWARRGYVHWVDSPEDSSWRWLVDWLINGYPKGVETLGFLVSRASGTSHPVNAPTLLYLPLGVLGAASLARTAGASRAAAAAVALVYALVPVHVSQANTTYVDAALAHSVAALVSLVAVGARELREGRAPGALVPSLGAALGLVAAAKPSGLAPAGLALVALVLAASVGRPRRGLRAVAAVAAVAALIAGYWYARSLWHRGNPLWPLRVTLLGRELLPGAPLEEVVSSAGVTPDVMKPWPGWVRLLYTWTQGALRERWPGSILYPDAREGGLGFLWVGAGLPALAWQCVRLARPSAPRDARWAVLGVPGLLLVPTFLLTPLAWWARYTSSVTLLGVAPLALWLDGAGARASGAGARLRRAGAALVTAVWVAVAAGEALHAAAHGHALSPGFLDRPPRRAVVSAATLWAALREHDGARFFYPLVSAERDAFGSEAGVGVGELGVPARALLGTLAMPLGRREIAFVARGVAEDPAALGALAARRGLRYLVVRDDAPPPRGLGPGARLLFHREGHWLLYDLEGGPPRPRVEPK